MKEEMEEIKDALELDTKSKIVVAMSIALAIGNVISAVAYGSKAIEGIKLLQGK